MYVTPQPIDARPRGRLLSAFEPTRTYFHPGVSVSFGPPLNAFGFEQINVFSYGLQLLDHIAVF